MFSFFELLQYTILNVLNGLKMAILHYTIKLFHNPAFSINKDFGVLILNDEFKFLFI